MSDEWFSPPSCNREGMRSLSPGRRKGKSEEEQRPRSASMPYGDAESGVASYPEHMDLDDEHKLDSSMEEEERSLSSSSASFVSAFSTQFDAPSASSERPYTPLLPSVLPPPDFFSIKPKLMYSSLGSGSGVYMHPYPSLIRQPPLLAYASSLHTEESLDMEDASEYADKHESHHSTLTLLDLRGSRITDRGLLRLSHPSPLSSLEIVKLDNCHGITGRGLIAFAHSNNLHTLSLANCRRLTDEAVVNVSHLGRSLMAVNLGGCRCLTDRSLEGLGGLRELRKLDLSQV